MRCADAIVSKRRTEGAASAPPHMQSHKAERVKTDAVTTDPVCGMKVDRAKALSAEIDGKRLYFCSEHCLHTFQHSVPEQPAANGTAHRAHTAGSA